MDERSDPAAARHRHEAEELAGEARQVVRAMEDFQDPSKVSGARGRVGGLRRDLPGGGLAGRRRVPDGGRAHPRPGQRHPRHRLGAQNPGPIAAIGVGAYITLAGLWASPISGASMNPARSFGPAAVAAQGALFTRARWPDRS